jgi:L-asparagine transporter-like permease
MLIAVLGLLVLFVPCYLGIQFGASLATLLGVVSMVPITLLVFLPFFEPATLHWDNVAGFPPADPATARFAFYTSWVFIMSWSVFAMEAAACYIGECRNPARDAKIAMTASSLYGFFIYVSLPLMLVVVLGHALGEDPLTVFLAYTEAIFGAGTWVKWVIGIPLVLALLLSVLNALMGCGRSLYQAAHDGVLPKFFQYTNRHGAPDRAMAFNLACSVVVVFIASPLEIYIFSNMGYLLSVCLALFGYFLYRQRRPAVPRPVRMPGFLRYAALGIGIALLFVWIYGGYHAPDLAVGPGKRWLFFLGLGIILLYLPLYAYRRYVEDRRAKAPSDGGGREQLEWAADKKRHRTLPMLMAGIKSRPVYTTLQPDPGGRHHLLAGQGSGGAALLRLLNQMPSGTDACVLYAGETLPGVAEWHLFPTEADLLAELDRTLSGCTMGTRLYAAGSESFLGSAVQVALKHALHGDALQCEHCGSAARRVYCIHCKASNENVTTNVVRCGGCGLHLLVRDHYSRRLAAYMGVMADAEAPGELPPVMEVFR